MISKYLLHIWGFFLKSKGTNIWRKSQINLAAKFLFWIVCVCQLERLVFGVPGEEMIKINTIPKDQAPAEDELMKSSKQLDSHLLPELLTVHVGLSRHYFKLTWVAGTVNHLLTHCGRETRCQVQCGRCCPQITKIMSQLIHTMAVWCSESAPEETNTCSTPAG